MKTALRLSAVMYFLLSALGVYAQAQTPIVQLDTVTKVIGIVMTLGGLFIGFMQMKMANKIAELEARVNKSLQAQKEVFEKKIETETEKLETKIALSGKEIEARMATRHDIDNIKTIVKANHDITDFKLEGLKELVKTADENAKHSAELAAKIAAQALTDAIKKDK